MLKDERELKPAAKATHVMEIRNEITSIVHSARGGGSENR
jgi:hypothetical protein